MDGRAAMSSSNDRESLPAHCGAEISDRLDKGFRNDPHSPRYGGHRCRPGRGPGRGRTVQGVFGLPRARGGPCSDLVIDRRTGLIAEGVNSESDDAIKLIRSWPRKMGTASRDEIGKVNLDSDDMVCQ